MEFLDNLVLPQSAEHISLLHYMTMLILFLFLPFISMVLGGATLSIFYKIKGLKENNSTYKQFSKDLIEITTINKSSGVILGIVPILALVLIFAQLLHTTNSPSIWYLSVSFISITVGLIYIYVYRYSLSFKDIFDSVGSAQKDVNPELKEQFSNYSERAKIVNNKSGIWGLIFLYLATYFYVAGITAAFSTETWGVKSSVLNLISSWEIFFRWSHFVIGSFILTGTVVLFNFFYWEGGRKNLTQEYSNFVRNRITSHTLINGAFLPIAILLSVFALPSSALSVNFFALVLIGLVLLFIAFHMLYDMLKNQHTKHSGSVFLLVLFSLIFIVISDQTAINNSTKKHSVVLAAQFEESLVQLKAASGGVGAISGLEIYNTKCAACHQFDRKLVGPPHKDVLVKYEGDIDKLVAFINNPTKVDPAYPPMPAQGLKPNEAKAVAKYILEEVKKY